MSASKLVRWRVIALAGIVAGFVAGGWYGTQRERNNSPWAREQLLSSALDSVRANYLDSLPEAELMRRAMSGMLRELNDPYAAVLEGSAMSNYRGTLRGESQGLGLLLRLKGKTLVVRQVYPGSPAEDAGLLAGDAVIDVDGQRAVEAWHSLRPLGGAGIAGDAADTVALRVVRSALADTLELTVRRSPWRMSAVSTEVLAAAGVGYVRWTSAASGSAEELEQAVERLEARGARSLVLDLRGNMGGLYEEGVRAASLFLPRGEVVASLERRGERTNQVSRVKRTRWSELPLVVLIDGATASSAELLAAALRDHGRALLVGEHSYGKGLVQRVLTINEEISLRLTTARWLPPSGVAITRRSEQNGVITGGLSPDIRILGAGTLDLSSVPVTLSPASARLLSDAVDAALHRAISESWSEAPIPLVERRIRELIAAELAPAVPSADRRAVLSGEGVRVALRRLLEMRGNADALWRYAAIDDVALRAALDVVAPGLSTLPIPSDDVLASPVAGLPTGMAADSATLRRLEQWSTMRFQGARVIRIDSSSAGPETTRPAARIEGPLQASQRDTVVAVHFSAGPFLPAYAVGERVRLADPSGSPIALTARVVARHNFRAPTVPHARAVDWRYGWSYLVVLAPESARAHASGFNGWRLVAAP